MHAIPIILAAATAFGAASSQAAAAPKVPASYAGDLPGANSAMRLHVDLLSGGRYQLRRTFVDKAEPGNRFDDIGRWRYDAQRQRVVLQGGREGTLYFVSTGNSLRMLDAKGRRVVSASGHNDLLRRLPKLAPIEPRLPMTGRFTYLADAPRIVLCANGQSLPVAQEGAYLPLERAYTAAKGMGKPILAQLEGTLTKRVGGEESLGPQPALVVERFDRLWPGKTCRDKLPAAEATAAPTAPAAAMPLRGTTWNLVQLGNTPVAALPEGRRAHLVLDANAPQLSGSGGCNRLMGGFETSGSALRFTGVGGTRMACPPELMSAENALLQALDKVASWKSSGTRLELSDAQGVLLARFEAQPSAVPPLRGTTWMLVELAGKSIITPADKRAPHLVLDAREPQYAGNVGCNQLIGGFESSGSALKFKGGGMTMMACEPELMAREDALSKALNATTSFRQQDLGLELLDAQGQRLARFEAPRK
jgi:copper homeostasis protein (lipoprotein)